MRTVFAISSAIALFATSVFAAENTDFNPVSFADEAATVADAEVVPASLTNDFVTFRWKGMEAVAMESFDLNVEDTARIQITDFKNRGDMFEVFDNGQSLGMTTKVDALKDEEVFAATPEEALNDDRFSKGVFDLGKGEHKITIKAMGPYEAGTAAIRVLDHANVAFYKNKKGHGGYQDDKYSHKQGGKGGKGEKGGWHKYEVQDDWNQGGQGPDEGGWGQGPDHGGWGQGPDHGGWGQGPEEGGWGQGPDEGGWGQGPDEGGWGQGPEEGGWGQGPEEGGWGQGGKDYEGGHKWGHKRPTNEELDFSHTITYTKTKWVIQRPTPLPI